MVDHCKICLEILLEMFRSSGNNHWADRMEADIREWDQSKRVTFLKASFGGKGSIVDNSFQGHTYTSLWKDHIFNKTCDLAYGLATGSLKHIPLDQIYYLEYGVSNYISGWQCESCPYKTADLNSIEWYLSGMLLPQIFIELALSNKMKEILDVENIIARKAIVEKREKLHKLIREAGVEVIEKKGWLSNCPKCGGTKMNTLCLTPQMDLDLPKYYPYRY